jgi:hypothetical protein
MATSPYSNSGLAPAQGLKGWVSPSYQNTGILSSNRGKAEWTHRLMMKSFGWEKPVQEPKRPEHGLRGTERGRGGTSGSARGSAH